MPDDLCPDCGEWGCDGECESDVERACTFCGEWNCDGSGYNCSDGHYQEYNLRGWPETTTGPGEGE